MKKEILMIQKLIKSFPPYLNEGKHTENHWYTAALFHYLNSVLKSIMAIVSSDKPDQEHS